MAIGYVDSRPGWDDTGITAVVIALVAGAFGALTPRLAWLSGLLVGGIVPLIEIPWQHNAGSLLALMIAEVAAYAGAGLRVVVGAPNAGRPR